MREGGSRTLAVKTSFGKLRCLEAKNSTIPIFFVSRKKIILKERQMRANSRFEAKNRTQQKVFLCTAGTAVSSVLTCREIDTTSPRKQVVNYYRQNLRNHSQHVVSSAAKVFRVTNTSNVGFTQEDLPTQVLIDGVINPCYITLAIVGKTNTIHRGAAVETTIAVNPKNPRNIVAAWQQDRMSRGGALVTGIAYTFDGGETWHTIEQPFFSCKVVNGDDSWLSFSADGKKLYLSGLPHNNFPLPDTPTQMAITIAISEDGGRTWSMQEPVAASNMFFNPALGGTSKGPFLDKPSCSADPNNSCNAYVTWDAIVPNGTALTAMTFFSRTTDEGKTWSNNTVSYGDEIWATMGELMYDPFGDLCAQGLSTCDRNFLTPATGFVGDNGSSTIGNVIIILPKATPKDKQWKADQWGDDENKAKRFSGNLLNFFARFYAPATATANKYLNDAGPITFFSSLADNPVVRSQDEGSHWSTTAKIIVPNTDYAGNARATLIYPYIFTGGYIYDANGNPISGNGVSMRVSGSALIPMVYVNKKNGFLYAVYSTGQFRDDFLPQIGLTTSRDGGYTWSERVRINQTPQDAPNPQAFTAAVAVTEDGYVGILYSDFRNDPVDPSNPTSVPNNAETLTDMWLDIYKEVAGPGSTGIGLDFVQELRLSENSYVAQHGPRTTSTAGVIGGYMTNGDYSTLVANEHNFYAAFTQSHDGPFNPTVTIYEDATTGTTIALDDNYRQSPYVSIIQPY
jgi:hypothetical protein